MLSAVWKNGQRQKGKRYWLIERDKYFTSKIIGSLTSENTVDLSNVHMRGARFRMGGSTVLEQTVKIREYVRNFSHKISLNEWLSGRTKSFFKHSYDISILWSQAYKCLCFSLSTLSVAAKFMWVMLDGIMTANSRTVICHSMLRKPGPLKLFLAFSHSWTATEMPILLQHHTVCETLFILGFM